MTRSYVKATAYENSPKEIANREARNRARAAAEKRLGHKLPTNEDVDHKVPLGDGGSTAISNTRVISESRNSAWRAGSKGYKVKPV